MRTVFFIILLIITNNGMNCTGSQKDFEIKSATKQKIYPGRQEAGWYEKYELTVIPYFSSQELSFDTLWINGKPYPCSVFQKGKKVKNNTFGKRDTVTISVNIHHQYHERLPILKRKPPIDYNGEALLVYSIKGKTKYKNIEKFEILENINYP